MSYIWILIGELPQYTTKNSKFPTLIEKYIASFDNNHRYYYWYHKTFEITLIDLMDKMMHSILDFLVEKHSFYNQII